jgi:predicted DNA-binding transcriptional regulator YafY
MGAMRASRLVTVLLLLQTRGRMTAAELAAELEVSERTVYRDVDALSASGVPIYAERGPHGGILLVEGYRTRLTGMTASEAEALFLSGAAGPAAELGLGTVVAAAQLKALAALPTELRARASRLVERFHLDVTGWYDTRDTVEHLAVITQAVWDSRRLELAYDRGDRLVERTVEPVGIVLKGGVWYLVAGIDGQLRTYRVSRVVAAEPTDETFERPASFDLGVYWQESIAAYERETPRIDLVLRVEPGWAGHLTQALGTEALGDATVLPDEDPEGWSRLRLRAPWPDEVPGRLLALGGHVEVLEPHDLRQTMLDLARDVLARHGAAAGVSGSAAPGPG